MRYTIKEFAEFSGVSIRTLHYYDEIGLLKPNSVNEATNYRYYGEQELVKMQEILFYRELSFPLKTIKELINNQSYNKSEALKKQKELLILKKQRLERIIKAIEAEEKGENKLDMKIFDNSEFESAREIYANEAKEKWVETDAYKEYSRKSSNIDFKAAESDMAKIFAEFHKIKEMGCSPESPESKALVKKLQGFITENFYTCTDEILLNLGLMYVNDERFKNNIDKSGSGTAEFVYNAINAAIN